MLGRASKPCIAPFVTALSVLSLALVLGCTQPVAPPSLTPYEDAGVHRLLVQPDDANKTNKAAIRSAIAGARRSIYLTIYQLQDQDIIKSMVAAKAANRALDVRVMFNFSSFNISNSAGRSGRADPNAAAKQAFTSAGIQWKNADPSFAVTHQKTFTFDEETSIIMTFNLNPDYFTGTRDFGVITRNKDEVSEIVTVFRNDWATPVIPSTPSLLVWSPTNSRQRLLGIFASANRSLDVYMEEFKDYGIADAIVASANRMKPSGGVVRVITAVLSSPGNPLADGNLAMRRYLSRNGVLARYGDWPVDPANPGGGKMYVHAKMVLADYETPGAQAYLGSENFSATSLDKNRELGIILRQSQDGPLLNTLNTVYASDWPRSKSDQ